MLFFAGFHGAPVLVQFASLEVGDHFRSVDGVEEELGGEGRGGDTLTSVGHVGLQLKALQIRHDELWHHVGAELLLGGNVAGVVPDSLGDEGVLRLLVGGHLPVVGELLPKHAVPWRQVVLEEVLSLLLREVGLPHAPTEALLVLRQLPPLVLPPVHPVEALLEDAELVEVPPGAQSSAGGGETPLGHHTSVHCALFLSTLLSISYNY